MNKGVGAVVLGAVLLVLTSVGGAAGTAPDRDLASIRGFNYTPSTAKNDIEFWRDYDKAQVEKELDLARRLQLNETRVFLNYTVYEREPKAFLDRVLHFVRAAHAGGIGVMIVVWDQCCETLMPEYGARDMKWFPNPGPSRIGRDFWPAGERYVADLVRTLAGEPGLSFWDIMNEPQAASQKDIREFVAHFAAYVRTLDPVTPITVGSDPNLDNLDAVGDLVDVLSYHDYSRTRAGVLKLMDRARAIGRKYGKPVIMTETGCVARANPYDMALEIFQKEGMGWYIWELMVSRSHWGRIHGVVYPDGTVRDPSIAAALLGFFRNRGADAIPVAPDQEKEVTEIAGQVKDWLAKPGASWEDGLSLAEAAANILEAGELIAMNDLPTRRVAELRRGGEDMTALRRLLERWLPVLEANRQR